MSTIRIIYAGTPEFSVPALQMLLDSSGYDVVAVYTQPDRPAGRGRALKASPVKRKAEDYALPVYQPESLKISQAQAELAALKADLMVVTAYGLLLPEAVLQMPELGCINIHASLLPRWRGAAPVQRAMLAGDDCTGITIMQMDKGLDTGAILAQQACPIRAQDTASDCHDRLMVLGAETLLSSLPAIANQTVVAQPQNNALATYAAKLSKAEAEINWHESAAILARKVRAYNDWPVAFSWWQKKNKPQMLRIWQADVVEPPGNHFQQADLQPGTVVAESDAGIEVITGNGVLRLQRIQPQGKRQMSAADFLHASSLMHQVLGNPNAG